MGKSINGMIYDAALRDFNKLPHVNNDDLRPNDLSHLVFRAQHELDLLTEGEIPDDMSFTKADQRKIRDFILLYGTKEEKERMEKDTPNYVKHRKRS